MKRSIGIVTVVIILLVAGGGYWRWRMVKAPLATKVATAAVQRSSLAATVNAAGNITAHQLVDLSFAQSGVAKKINVKVGDRVTAGQLLAEADTADLNLQLRRRGGQSQSRAGQAGTDSESDDCPGHRQRPRQTDLGPGQLRQGGCRTQPG